MSGIFGFISQESTINGDKLLKDMAVALDPKGHCQFDLYHEEGLGMGRANLGIVNPEPQPIWNADRTVCLVMDGEIYDYQRMRDDLLSRGYHFQVDNDAEFLLHMFEEYGEGFAKDLNGAFVAAIADLSRKQMILINDRLGLYQLYYANLDGSLIFASGVRALLAHPALPHSIDKAAIAEFLTFDHVLNDRTLLEDVHLFPQGTMLVYSGGRVKMQQYWSMQYPEHYDLRSEQDYIDEFLVLIRQAVKRQVSHDTRTQGILLSGGLDSRFILPYMYEFLQPQPVPTFTWGIPGSDDGRYAREISKRVGSQYHFFELQPDWLLHKAEEAVQITDGMGNLVNMHALATLDQEVKIAPIIYKGFLGDAMMGYGLRYQFWSAYDVPTTSDAHFQVHNDQGVITFNMQEQGKLFTESFQKSIGNSVMENYRLAMKASGSSSPAAQRLYFDFTQRVPRMTIKGVEAVRSQAVARLPYADNDLVDFSISVPPGLLYERRLVKHAIIQAFPELAQVPITETGLPMMACARDVFLRARELARWHLKLLGLDWICGQNQRPTKQYDLWFRTELRSWVEGLLLSQRTFERGYFNPVYLRKIVSEHMNGENHSVNIGALLSIELWHRQYID